MNNTAMNETEIIRERLELALEAAGLDLWENDLVAGVVTKKATKVFAELGYSEQDAAALVEDIFRIVHPDDIAPLKTAVNLHLNGKIAQYRSEFRLKAKNGSWIWYGNYGRIMDRANGGRRLIGVTFNIHDRKCREQEIELMNQQLQDQNRLLERANQQLLSLAITDSLTGVYNRRKFIEAGEAEFHRARRQQNALSLLMLDVDNFKAINDNWGHAIGDSVLRAIAAVCRLSVRHEVDVVARIGGEEFGIVLPQVGFDDAFNMAERLRASVASMQMPNEEPELSGVRCSVSIGVVSMTEEWTSFEHMLNHADKALYLAKQSGRNTVRALQHPPG